MKQRKAEPSDAGPIQRLYEAAFDPSENELVGRLAIELLIHRSTPETINWVAETALGVVGHIALSPFWSKADRSVMGWILAPLAVAPEKQKSGIGTALVKTGLRLASSEGMNSVLVYGDPAFYQRFGFEAEIAKNYLPPYKLKYDFGWQALHLKGTPRLSSPQSIDCLRPLLNPDLW